MDMDYKPNSHKYKEEQNSPSEKRKLKKLLAEKLRREKRAA